MQGRRQSDRSATTHSSVRSTIYLQPDSLEPRCVARAGVSRRSAMTEAAQVSKLLREFGQRTALRGGNPYRAQAYQRAAESLAALTEPLDKIIAQGRLQTLPGVGPAIAGMVQELSSTGTHPTLEAMRKEVPAGVLDLEHAAREGRLAKVTGLGPALERKVLQGLEIRRKGGP